jgi:lipopolysaccharide export LptBFGC system permease protein LptF
MRILGSPGMEGKPPYVPPYVAAWFQNVLFVVAGIFVLKRSE